jgi:hypothetical protein
MPTQQGAEVPNTQSKEGQISFGSACGCIDAAPLGRGPGSISEPQASKPMDGRQGDKLIEILKTRPATVAQMVATGISRYPIKRVKECLPPTHRLCAWLNEELDIVYRVEPLEAPKVGFLDEVNAFLSRLSAMVRGGAL